jgi:predicted GNAT family acetyltransferase
MNMDNPHGHQDEQLDEALDETFPASDPPANTVETGIVPRDLPSPLPGMVVDNSARSRLEINAEGETAFLIYRREPGSMTLVHTDVPEDLRGRRLGTALVERALEMARSEGRRTIVECPFARAYLRKHPATQSGRE